MGKQTRIQDIAEAAGVSASTVSFVLNGRAEEMRVSSIVEERVRRVAQELSYVPSSAARALAARRMHEEPYSLAILTPVEAPPATTWPVIRGIQVLNIDLNATRQRAFQIIVETYRHGRLEESADYFDRTQTNGIIVTNSSPSDDAYLEKRKPALPLVALNRHIPGIDCVNADYEADGERAAEYLLERHAKRPIALRTPMQTQVVIRRRIGFLRRLEEAQVTLKDEVVCKENNEFSARDALLEQVADFSGIDSIYCLEPYLAVGIRAAMAILGLRIPDDILITGEPQSTSALLDRSASFEDVPIVRMAYEAARLIHRTLSGHHRSGPIEVLFEGGEKLVRDNPADPSEATDARVDRLLREPFGRTQRGHRTES